jgi:hypothetical protein
MRSKPCCQPRDDVGKTARVGENHLRSVTDGIAYPLRETQPTEVDVTAAGIELQI